jgi:hypothetical protein
MISDEFLSGITDSYEKRSVHHAVQNHFFPDAGNFRGVADGSGNSCLATYQTSSTLTASATNTVTTFYITPTVDQTANAFGSAQLGTFSSPFNSTSGAVYSNIAGGFNGSNPSTDYRVVSTTMRISPTGSFTNQSAEGKVAYISDIARLGTSATTNANWTQANVDNLEWSLPVNGLTDIMTHWVPNDYETKFRGAGYAKNSGIVGYLVSNNANTTWRIDVKYVIEYFPTVSFAPFVQSSPPDMHPSTYYHFNHVCRALSYPLIIGEYKEWVKMYEKFKAASGGIYSVPGSFALNSDGLAKTSVTDRQAYQPGYVGQGLKYALGAASSLVPSFYMARSMLAANNPAGAIRRNGGRQAQPMAPENDF